MQRGSASRAADSATGSPQPAATGEPVRVSRASCELTHRLRRRLTGRRRCSCWCHVDVIRVGCHLSCGDGRRCVVSSVLTRCGCAAAAAASSIGRCRLQSSRVDSADEATKRSESPSSTLQSADDDDRAIDHHTTHRHTDDTISAHLTPHPHDVASRRCTTITLVMTSRRRLDRASNSIHPPAAASSAVSSKSINHILLVLISSDLSAVIAVDRI
jgi:hypothetical protein